VPDGIVKSWPAVAVPLIGSSDARNTEVRTAAQAVEVEPAGLPAAVRQRWTWCFADSSTPQKTHRKQQPNPLVGHELRLVSEDQKFAQGRVCR
jgi:hypothetical protein